MLPVLLKIGPITIYTYGLLVASGFALGVVWSMREARKAGLDANQVLDLCFYLVLAAIVGSRLLFVVIDWDQYRAHPLNVFKLWEGGLVFYGGLIGAIILFIFFVRWKNMPFWLTSDVMAPGIALGQGIGRLGCLAAGCCYGRSADLPWAITFTHERCLAPLNQPLHPTQLYHSLWQFALFTVLILLKRRRRFFGQLFWTYCLLHGVGRLVVERFRGDFRGAELLAGLTSTQMVSWALILVSVLMMMVLPRTRRIPDSPKPAKNQ